MAYTLRGRVESRLAAALLPFLAACVLAVAADDWWPLQLAGLMVTVGLLLDVAVYHRLLAYQPGWLALPLGALELVGVMVAARVFAVEAPLEPAVAFFAASWLVTQLLAHAGFPLVHLTYAEDGGELGRAGAGLWAFAPAALAAVSGIAWATQPPTVRLEAGVHRGPLVLDRSQRLVGEPGAVVRGGIVITADDVTLRGVTVHGGENGIVIDGADDVLIEDVRVSDVELDGIHVRRGSVTVRDCRIELGRRPFAQGIDISFSFDRPPSVVDGCLVTGGLEGLVSHFARVEFRDNVVRDTRLRAITVTEMSMGTVADNVVHDAHGVGIFCGDYSHCSIEDNLVRGTRPDLASHDRTRLGVAIEAHFGAVAEVARNELHRNGRAHARFVGAKLRFDEPS